MKNVIELHNRRVKKWSELLEEKIKEAKDEFSFITNEVLEDHVKTGETTLEDVVKTLWSLVERVDQLEVEIIKLKLIILEAQNS